MARKMKDSGVEWIGEIPEDWEVVRNKHLFGNKKEIVGNRFETTDRLALTLNGVIDRDKFDSEGLQPTNFDTYQKVYKNNLIFKLIDLENINTSRVGLAHKDGMVSPAYVVLHSNNNNNNKNDMRFYYYIYLSMWHRNIFNMLGDGGVRSNLNKTELLNLNTLRADYSIQKSIADFLDKKTQEIDNIISKTKKAIEEYKKYKQSLITETVTKGLDENVEMKDSGIEWIGETPEHWDIIRPNRVCKILRGNSSFQKTDLESKGDYIALQYGRTYKVDIVDDSYRHYVDRSFYKSDQIVENGDTVLISTSETMEDLGHSCFYNRDDIGLLGGEQMCLKPNKDNVQGKFLYYATKYFHIELNQYATGLKVYRFRLDDLKKINMVLPPKDEQYKIISFLDEKLPLIDQIISTKEKLLIEMEAYKKSLIYETVTGKREVE